MGPGGCLILIQWGGTWYFAGAAWPTVQVDLILLAFEGDLVLIDLFQDFGRRPRWLDQGAKTVTNGGGREGGGIHTCLLCASYSGVMPRY